MAQTTGDLEPRDPYIEPIPNTAESAADARYDYTTTGEYVQNMSGTGPADDVDMTDAAYASDESSDAEDVTDDESTDDIRGDIEDTRSHMSETIDAIQAKLSPQRLTEQAKEIVHDATIGRVEHAMNDMTDSARDTGYTLLDTVRQNPIPLALAGIGIGWLAVRLRENAANRGSSHQRDRYTQYNGYGYQGNYQGGSNRYYGDTSAPYRQTDYGQYPNNGAGPYYSQSYGQGYSQGGNGPSLADQAQSKVGQATDAAQNVAGQVTDKAQQVAGQVTDQAQQVAGQLQDQAQQVAYQAQQGVYRAQGWFQRTLDENPLALGLVALAGGALAGLAVPETDQERQWMGPARDQLVEKAQEKAQDTLQKAQQVAEKSVSAATDTAKSEAQKQNLTH